MPFSAVEVWHSFLMFSNTHRYPSIKNDIFDLWIFMGENTGRSST